VALAEDWKGKSETKSAGGYEVELITRQTGRGSATTTWRPTEGHSHSQAVGATPSGGFLMEEQTCL